MEHHGGCNVNHQEINEAKQLRVAGPYVATAYARDHAEGPELVDAANRRVGDGSDNEEIRRPDRNRVIESERAYGREPASSQAWSYV